MRVLCVKQGDKYGPEWVLRLRGMVEKHVRAGEFVCITDRPVDGVTCVPLETTLQGWWSKTELFKPGRFPGVNMYFDLDVVVRAQIPELPHPGAYLWALDDFSYSLRKPKRILDSSAQALLGGPGTCNSSVMQWDGDGRWPRLLWDSFDPSCMRTLHGDQNYISKTLWPMGLKLFSDGLACSYKYHLMREGSAAPIVVFHGNPKPSELPKSHELRKLWEAA